MTRFVTVLAVCLVSFSAQAASGSNQSYREAFHTMHRNMDISYSGDVDTDFTRGMIPHHQGAVDMAAVALEHGDDPDIRALAEWISYIQQIEIAQMKHWLTRFAKPSHLPKRHHTAVDEFTQQMHKMHVEMDIVYTGDADIDMVMGMIPHHQAAIDMAYTLLRHGRNPELEPLAWGIIRSQSSEIAYMKRWLKRQGIDFEETHAKYMRQRQNKPMHAHH